MSTIFSKQSFYFKEWIFENFDELENPYYDYEDFEEGF